ncbi:hypothetical protein CGI75_24025 [Vibrio parahaemolyticus]|nr:hypothetical protein CGI75_24025 [Vibrio parahaemolyticus]
MAIFCGILASASCALREFISLDQKDPLKYPESDEIDNKITRRRLGWFFLWLVQGIIGALVVAFYYSDDVFNNDYAVGKVWALCLLAGVVFVLSPKESLASIKKLLTSWK